jgi:hypothetical protein
LKALHGPPAQGGDAPLIVPEIHAHHAGQGEHDVAVRYRKQDFADRKTRELEHLPCMAAGAESSPLAAECHEHFVSALGSGTANAGEAVSQIAAIEIVPNHLVRHRPEETVALLESGGVIGAEVIVVGVEAPPLLPDGGLLPFRQKAHPQDGLARMQGMGG